MCSSLSKLIVYIYNNLFVLIGCYLIYPDAAGSLHAQITGNHVYHLPCCGTTFALMRKIVLSGMVLASNMILLS